MLTGSGDVLEPEGDADRLGDRDRLGRQLRARGGARAAADRTRRGGDRAPLDEDRLRDLRLHQYESRPRKPLIHDRFFPARDRLRTRSLHRRPGQGQARRRHRAAQPLAPAAPRLADARGGDAEEHPDDRPDRLRQDRDRAPPRQARGRAVPQGRGDQVHRGRLCRARRRADRARSRRDRHCAGQAAQAPRGRGQGRTRRRGARARCAGRRDLVGCDARGVPQEAARRRTRRQGDRDRAAAGRERPADVRTAQHARRLGRRDQPLGSSRQGLRQAHQAEAASPSPTRTSR